MIKKINKNDIRKARHARQRNTVSGTATHPRLNVYRSLNHIYAQLIDDTALEGKGTTLVAASTVEKEVAATVAELTKTDAAKAVGKLVAERALKAGITTVVFDRGGYLYTGRVAAVAEGARSAGLQF